MGTPVDTSGWRIRLFIFIFLFLTCLVTINYFLVDANYGANSFTNLSNGSGVPHVDSIGKLVGILTFNYIDNPPIQAFFSIIMFLCIFIEGWIAYTFIKEWF